MRPRLIAAATAVLLLALTGCAAGSEAPTTSDSASTAPDPSAASAPLVAESPKGNELDTAFVEFVRSDLVPNSGIRGASDEQLITAGHEACAQIEAGAAAEDLRLVEGEEPQPSGYFADSGSIVTGALSTYCPELVPTN